MRYYIAMACSFALIGSAHAQVSTDCMAMGPNMVHCNSMDMSPSQNNGQGAYNLGVAIGVMKEKSLRSKIGKMVAAGDCSGAYAYAMKKGRFDLAGQVKQYCGG